MEEKLIIHQIKEHIGKVIIGKDNVIELILTALLAGGHLLLEDVPGVGKTTLVASLAKTIDCSFRRIQFTPDVLPSDVAGFTLYDLKTGEKQVQFGAVMSQIVLADEINRTSPKTQSSLLEVMEEHQVTIDGVTYPLPEPFLVLATQNPVESTGTYPLPEAQLDRFMMKISIGYPRKEEEVEILKSRLKADPLRELEAIVKAEDILALQEKAKEIRCDDAIMNYIVALAEQTRSNEMVAMGVSPRGSLALLRAARAYAMVKGRDYVLPDDIQHLVKFVFAHRMMMSSQASLKRTTAEEVVGDILRIVPIPKVNQ